MYQITKEKRKLKKFKENLWLTPNIAGFKKFVKTVC